LVPELAEVLDLGGGAGSSGFFERREVTEEDAFSVYLYMGLVFLASFVPMNAYDAGGVIPL
jgi:hypothetical protein